MPDHRRYTFKIYPTPAQEASMLDIKGACQRLYNAMLEQRQTAYKQFGVSLGFYQQKAEIKDLKAEFPEYKAVHTHALQGVAKRLDQAFKHFFRRVKNGETPGYPRFKSFQRYKGWDYFEHGRGYWLFLNDDGKHGGTENGHIKLHGIGRMRFRGSVPIPGKPKTCTIMHKSSGWYASVVFEYQEGELQRESGKAATALDWGVKTFLTGVGSNGGSCTVENPKPLKKAQKKLKREQRRLSRKKRGSNNRKKQVKRVAKVHEKVANTRKDFMHKTSHWLIKLCALIAVEKLNIRNMTRRGGAYKTGLNRAILDTSPAAFHKMLKYKAAEAGAEYIVIDTRKWKPTQTCSCCGHQAKKRLSDRVHHCLECGFICDRDVNAARVILSVALYGHATGLPVPQDMREQPELRAQGTLVESHRAR